MSELPLRGLAELLAGSGAVIGNWNQKHGLVSYDGNLRALIGPAAKDYGRSPHTLVGRYVRPDHRRTLVDQLTELAEKKVEKVDLTFSTVDINASSLRLRAKWSGEDIVFFLEDASSYFDGMTGLPNRTYITRHLPRLLKRTVDRGGGLAVLYADLQNFKRFNDTQRHEAGNMLIGAFADRLVETVSQYCVSPRHKAHAICPGHVVARQHGDEFLVILLGIHSQDKAIEVSERIVADINACPYELAVAGSARTEAFEVLASVGLAYADSKDVNATEILDRADAAMFAAKLDDGFGPSHFAVYSQSIRDAMMHEEHKRQAIGEALRNRNYDLVFQPFVDIRPDRYGYIMGAEVLLRPKGPWQADNLEEEFRLIDSFKRTPELMTPTMVQVCELINERLTSGRRGFLVSVNIAAEQILKRDHFNRLVEVLARYPAAAQWVILEITERTKIHSASEIKRRLSSLIDLGVMLAIDDFGTEYANADIVFELGYLLSFVKIAGQYIKAIGDPLVEARAGIFITHLTALARKMSINVIYEGVETAFQSYVLRAAVMDQEDDDEREYTHHYAFGQGRYYHSPMSWAELSAAAGD